MNTKYMILLYILIALTSLPIQAEEDDLYDFLWLDPDKKVYVLQNKVFPKKHTLYANIGFIKGLSSDFQDTKGFNFTAGYYLSEEWAVELLFNKYSHSDNEAFSSIQLVNQSIPFIRRLNHSFGALAIWSPFYGKVNTFNKIFYFDWYFGVGVSSISAESNANNVSDPNAANIFQKESYLAVLMKSGLRVHLTKKIHFGVEYLNTSFKAKGPVITGFPQSNKLRFNGDLLLNIGLSF